MMQGPMMQALLEERFGRKLQKETREIPAFALTEAPNRPQLPPSRQGACVAYDRNNPPPAPAAGKPAPILCGVIRENAGGGFDVLGVTLADLCRSLSAYVDRDIVDKTGITGTFDVHLDMRPVKISGISPFVEIDRIRSMAHPLIV